MDLEMIILSEVSQTEKDKYRMISLMWNLKSNTNESVYKTETVTDMQNKFMITSGEREGGIN